MYYDASASETAPMIYVAFLKPSDMEKEDWNEFADMQVANKDQERRPSQSLNRCAQAYIFVWQHTDPPRPRTVTGDSSPLADSRYFRFCQDGSSYGSSKASGPELSIGTGAGP